MNRTDTAVIEYKCANPNMMFDTSDVDDTNSGRKSKVDGKKFAYKRMASHNILTEEEEKSLFEQYHSEDPAAVDRAKEKLVLCNIRLVIKEVRKVVPVGLEDDDLLQEGILGLYHAIEKYDPTKCSRFAIYAISWIRQSIIRALQEKGRVIRIPVYVQEKMTKMNKVRNELSQYLGRIPSAEEMACCFPELSPKRIQEIEKYMITPLSADFTYAEDDEVSIADLFPDYSSNVEKKLERESIRDSIHKFLAECLSGLEIIVIGMRFGIDRKKPMTLQEIGDEFGFTKERIRQIEVSALSKLRKDSELAELFASYIESQNDYS